MLKQKQVIYLKRKSVKKNNILANWLLVLFFQREKMHGIQVWTGKSQSTCVKAVVDGM